MRGRRNSRGRNQNKKKLNRKFSKNITIEVNKKQIIILSILFIFVFIFSVLFAILNMGSNKIVRGIKINGINVSRLTSEQAQEKIKKYYENCVLSNITVKGEDFEEIINPNEIINDNNIDEIIKEVNSIGRHGNIIVDNYEILFTLIFNKNYKIKNDYNEEKIKKIINDLNGKLPEAVVETSYYIENSNLIIKKGQDGKVIDEKIFKKELKETLYNSENREIIIPVKEQKASEIDVEKIHSEIYKEAKDAYVTENPTKIHAEVIGVDFEKSIDEIKENLQIEGEEYIIALKITIPEITLSNMGLQEFPDKLSEFTTRYDASNKNRSINLGLASDKINETVVMPGEVFSYNKIVGQRTIAAGYKEAMIYSGGKAVQGIGGGICQLSTTLYDAVLYANLEVISRSNHRFLTSYAKPGRDATVSWGTIDFAFRNNRTFPIKIVSSVSNGIAKVSIYGIKEDKEYEVVLETNILEETEYKISYINDNTIDEGQEYIEQDGENGIKSETYKILKLKGVEVSKELISTDLYAPLEMIIRKGTKKIENKIIEDKKIKEDDEEKIKQ